MPRYTIGTRRAWVEDDWGSHEDPLVPELSVDGPAEVNTGLVSLDGQPIYRLQSPIGFGRDGEW